MFTTLLESGRAAWWRPVHSAHPALSFATHAAALVALTGASGSGIVARDVPEERVTYVAPRFRVLDDEVSHGPRKAEDAGARPGVPAGAVRLRTPREVPDRIPPAPPVDLAVLAIPVITDVVDDALDPSRIMPSGAELGSGVTDATFAAARRKGYAPIAGSAADLFERGLVAFENNPLPQYPPRLLAAEVEGAVLVAFVVDTTGRADPRTMQVLHSSNELFTRAVRRVLPRMRFRPTYRGAPRAAILAEQQFIFRIHHAGG